MTMWKSYLSLCCSCLFLTSTAAFVPSKNVGRCAVPTTLASSTGPNSNKGTTTTTGTGGYTFPMEKFDGIKNAIDVDKLNKSTESMKASLFDGEFGARGETFVVAQVILLFCIVSGSIPIVGDIVLLVLGPGFLLLGLGLMVSGVTELGDALSPWPVVSSTNKGLKTEGLYAQVRHPLYAGLLTACLGLSLVTGSALRLLLTGALGYVLYLKADYEEDELEKAFPEYLSYREKTPGKFVPKEILDLLPWNQN